MLQKVDIFKQKNCNLKLRSQNFVMLVIVQQNILVVKQTNKKNVQFHDKISFFI